MKNYVIKFISESGDHVTLGCYTNEDYPTGGQLDALARQKLDHEIVGNFLYGRFDITELGEGSQCLRLTLLLNLLSILDAPSSSGRTGAFEAFNAGSNPAGASN